IPQVMTPVPVLHSRTIRREPESLKVTAIPTARPAAAKEDSIERGPEAAPKPAAAKAAEPAVPAPVAPAPQAPPDNASVRAPEPSGRSPESASKPPPVLAGKVRDLGQRSEGTARPRTSRLASRSPAVVRMSKLPSLKQRPPVEEK